jgi:multidrug efflux pump subunit AcrA (membrane-fusion protein)
VDQASVDTAQANLTDAQEAVAGADLVSTIAGTVASVSIAAGDSVTAGSSTSSGQVVVIGQGSTYDLTTDVAVTDIGKVAVGQPAQVTPDSTNTVIQGHVSSIGVVATTGSTSTTYPVTITLDSPDLGGLSGVDGDVQIVTQRSADVTTVPSSAVRTVGTIHLLTVIKDGTPTPVRVTLGTVGDILTQVTSGVTRGEVVSLADLNEALPSTSSTTTRFGGGLGGSGAFGGGLGGGGGFGGGGFGGFRAGGG